MRIAVAQAPGVTLDQWQGTLTLLDDLIERAADAGADLVALPECAWPAYCLGSKPAYFAARDAGLPPTDIFLEHVAEQARAKRINICAGYVEEHGDRLANAACLIDPAGRCLGVHRKCFLWDFDHDYFEPGQTITPIATPHGPIGLMICADARLPEIPATLASAGVNLILQPTGWVNAGTAEQLWNPQPDFLIPARAREFAVPIASASKWGQEGDTTFVGSSLICDATGSILAQCGQEETAVAVAEVNMAPARPPGITAAQRVTLLSETQPAAARTDGRPLDVLPLPVNATDDLITRYVTTAARPDRALLAIGYRDEQQPAERGVQIPGAGIAVVTGAAPSPFLVGNTLVASTATAEVERFAPLRELALRGVCVVVALGASVHEASLRARACENRIFVLAVSPAGYTISDPSGCVIAHGDWPVANKMPTPVSLSLSLASDKNAAPRTNMLLNRQTSQYRFQARQQGP